MSVPEPRPPALSRRLLEWAAGRLRTPDLADDAADVFAERARRHGERAARRWYRRQALATLKPLMSSRPASARGARSAPESPMSRGPVSQVSLLDFRLGGSA